LPVLPGCGRACSAAASPGDDSGCVLRARGRRPGGPCIGRAEDRPPGRRRFRVRRPIAPGPPDPDGRGPRSVHRLRARVERGVRSRSGDGHRRRVVHGRGRTRTTPRSRGPSISPETCAGTTSSTGSRGRLRAGRNDGLGPMTRLLSVERLPAGPSLGDCPGRATTTAGSRWRRAAAGQADHRADSGRAPRAKIGHGHRLTSRPPIRQVLRTDSAIVAAARAATRARSSWTRSPGSGRTSTLTVGCIRPRRATHGSRGRSARSSRGRHHQPPGAAAGGRPIICDVGVPSSCGGQTTPEPRQGSRWRWHGQDEARAGAGTCPESQGGVDGGGGRLDREPRTPPTGVVAGGDDLLSLTRARPTGLAR